MPVLRSDGLPLELAPGIVIRTPGLEGEAFVYDVPGLTTPVLAQALVGHAFRTLRTIEIRHARETFSPPSALPPTKYAEGAIVLLLSKPNAAFRQVVLMQDEAGLAAWSFAEPAEARPIAAHGDDVETFVLRRYVPPTPPPGTQRGLVDATGTKVIRVLEFPIEEIAGDAATWFATKWEAKNRPYGLRVVTAANYGIERGGDPVDAATWSSYEGKPILLFVHGTFSTSGSTYSGLPTVLFNTLATAYGNRILEFDHPTMTQTPRQNAEWLLEQVPEEGQFIFDALTHSRGGLVMRSITERATALSVQRDVAVRTLVLAAAPDNGTVLTDAQYMSDFVDTYTNFLNFFPEVVPIAVFDCVLEVVKEIAVGSLENLCGLQSMTPNGPFQQWLNQGPKESTRYFAIGSAYTPNDSALSHWAEKRLMDAIFKQNNDMVVPTAGVYEVNGSGSFPIASGDCLVFGGEDGVWHCNYFTQPAVHEKIRSWLPTS